MLGRMLLIFRCRCVGLVFVAAIASMGCVTEAHRRVLEGVRVRGVRLAEYCTDETVPAERRQDAIEIVQGAAALQRQAVPKPKTVVVGTTEEFQKDLADAKAFDTTYLKVKQLAKGALEWAATQWPWLTGVGSALGVALALGKKLMTKGKALTAAIKITTKIKDAVSSDADTLEKIKGVMTAAKTDGADFVSGSKELYAEYVAAKAKGNA